jgi:hypothetical protein
VRRILCVLCMVLISTVAFGQDFQEKPTVEPIWGLGDIFEKVAEPGMPEWEIKAKAAIYSALAYPSELRQGIAIAVAEAQGLETYVFDSGCLVIFEGENILVGPVMEEAGNLTKKFIVLGLPGETCMDVFCSSWPAYAPSCTTRCDGHFGNYVITCWEGSQACCGCNRIYDPPNPDVEFPCGYCTF